MKRILLSGVALVALSGAPFAACPAVTVADSMGVCNPLMLVGPTVLGGSVKACSCLIERRANFGNTN